MILNLLRVNDLSVEDMMKRSFSEFRTQRALTSQNLAEKLRNCEQALGLLEERSAKAEEESFDGISGIENYLDFYESCRYTPLCYLLLTAQQMSHSSFATSTDIHFPTLTT